LNLALRGKYFKVKKYFAMCIKESARQTHKFVVRQEKRTTKWGQRQTHEFVLRQSFLKVMTSCVRYKAHNKVFKNNDTSFIQSGEEGEKYFIVRGGENTRQKQDLAVCFFLCRGSYKKCTTKMVFAVRPKEDEQQRWVLP
jgi:hypothetical protein